jgi:hypothetical protein
MSLTGCFGFFHFRKQVAPKFPWSMEVLMLLSWPCIDTTLLSSKCACCCAFPCQLGCFVQVHSSQTLKVLIRCPKTLFFFHRLHRLKTWCWRVCRECTSERLVDAIMNAYYNTSCACLGLYKISCKSWWLLSCSSEFARVWYIIESCRVPMDVKIIGFDENYVASR